MRILYFADIRFPLERANGIQTMETCHALAGRGHEVHLVVRPDTHTPARDPFAYYGLPRSARLIVEHAPVAGPQVARRIGYLTFAATRAVGAGRADIVMTRDLAVASLLLRLPVASSARLRIARLCAGGRGGAAASRVDGDGTASVEARAAGTTRVVRVAARRRLRHDHQRPGIHP